MKIIELEICNIRGIRYASIRPGGESFMIFGANGTGKSTYVDAIDFLLTGNMARLTGHGTQETSVKEHGPHVDCFPGQAYVAASIQLANGDSPVKIKRVVGDTKGLIYDSKWKADVERLESIAHRRFFILTRKHVLQYVTAQPATRADLIPELLNLSNIEAIRETFGSVDRHLQKDVADAANNYEQRLARACNVIGAEERNVEALLHAINAQCEQLGLPRLRSLAEFSQLSSVPRESARTTVAMVTAGQFTSNLEALLDTTSAAQLTRLASYEQTLRESGEELKSDPSAFKSARATELLEVAKRTIDDETLECPVCASRFEHGALNAIVEQRLQAADTANVLTRKMTGAATAFRNHLNSLLPSIEVIIEACKQGLDADLCEEIDNLRVKIAGIVGYLILPVESYTSEYLPPAVDELDLDRILELRSRLEQTVSPSLPTLRPNDESRDLLVKVHDRLFELDSARDLHTQAMRSAKYSASAKLHFSQAQDDILNNVYSLILDRFSEFYNFIHSAVDGDLVAEMTHSGPSLSWRVSFGQRGYFAPYAVHSEGHQDTMGLCLFLALSELLRPEGLDLIILDDVINSVDADHRSKIADLLRTQFAERQMLLTTHDRHWMRQLLSKQVVNKKNARVLYGWSLETGPKDRSHLDPWDMVSRALEEENVSQASFFLRNGMEAMAAEICFSLQAPVRFKFEPTWDFGELFYPAKKRYSDLVGQAYRYAEKQGDEEKMAQLRSLKKRIKNINSVLSEDLWMVNAAVHHNQWENLSPSEFRSIADCLRDFVDIVHCENCEMMIQVTLGANNREIVRCECGVLAWQL